MFLIFAVIFGGILSGCLFRGRRLGFVQPAITAIIWLLLFLLGVEVGSDPEVVGGLATLGVAALAVFACSVVGSIAASWLLWRRIRRHRSAGTAKPQEEDDGDGRPAEESSGQSMWTALKGSLVGLFTPFNVAGTGISTWVLYALMFCVGITLGHDASLAGRVRQLDPRLALLPLATAFGTLLGAAVSALLLPWSVADTLAVGAGFGYYSLSSIFITDFRGPELATVALLCNVMREIFTLLAAPLVARLFGPLAAVSIGGATTFDTTLPIITRAAGRPYAVVSIFHGCALDFSVPFLVTFFCSL